MLGEKLRRTIETVRRFVVVVAGAGTGHLDLVPYSLGSVVDDAPGLAERALDAFGINDVTRAVMPIVCLTACSSRPAAAFLTSRAQASRAGLYPDFHLIHAALAAQHDLVVH